MVHLLLGFLQLYMSHPGGLLISGRSGGPKVRSVDGEFVQSPQTLKDSGRADVRSVLRRRLHVSHGAV